MRTLALVFPQGSEYCRLIRDGAVEELERFGGWQVLQLPVHESGRIPVKCGMETLDGVIAWVDRKHKWMRELSTAGVPVVNCGGDWRGEEGIGTVSVDLPSVLGMVLDHFGELSLTEIRYFSHNIWGNPAREALLDQFRELAEARGMEVGHFETQGENPEENLERLLVPEKQKRLIEEFAAMDHPIGIFSENDYFGRLACTVAALAGKRVPVDFAVLGTSGDLLGRYGSPTISTVILPGEEVGRAAFRMIEAVHQGVPMPRDDVKIKARTLVVRESTGGKARDVAMERVHRWITRKALHGLTVQELPEIAGMSLKALRRRYSAIYGMEPSEQIRRLRLSEAKRLLSKTDTTVADIAISCGFSSQAAFYNYFLRHEKISPSRFRRKAEKNRRKDEASS